MGTRNGEDEWDQHRNQYRHFSTADGTLCGAQKRRCLSADQADRPEKVNRFGRKTELNFDEQN
jgi:hypothetical protein